MASLQPTIKGRNARQELRQRPQRNTAHWLTADLLSLLSYITQDGLPKDGAILTGLYLFTQSLTKKMSPKTSPRDSVVEDIPPLRVSSLCQDRKTNWNTWGLGTPLSLSQNWERQNCSDLAKVLLFLWSRECQGAGRECRERNAAYVHQVMETVACQSCQVKGLSKERAGRGLRQSWPAKEWFGAEDWEVQLDLSGEMTWGFSHLFTPPAGKE